MSLTTHEVIRARYTRYNPPKDRPQVLYIQLISKRYITSVNTNLSINTFNSQLAP